MNLNTYEDRLNQLIDHIKSIKENDKNNDKEYVLVEIFLEGSAYCEIINYIEIPIAKFNKNCIFIKCRRLHIPTFSNGCHMFECYNGVVFMVKHNSERNVIEILNPI